MAADEIRPSVSDLVFHLFDRPLHPELFDIHAIQAVQRPDYQLTIRITRTGHALTWENSRGHLTELAAVADAPLPAHGSLLKRKMRGEYTTAISLVPGLRYQSSFQVETLPEEIFQHVHDEILRDGLKRGVLHNFRPHNRWLLAPLGYVTTEAWSDNFVVSTFHTFPEELTIVKTQSLIEHHG